jgi:hypothetical protein
MPYEFLTLELHILSILLLLLSDNGKMYRVIINVSNIHIAHLHHTAQPARMLETFIITLCKINKSNILHS